MNKNQNQIVSLLSDAINDVIVGQDTKATQTLVSAIKLLNETTTTTQKEIVAVARTTAGRPTGSKNKRKHSNTRFNPAQIADIKSRIAQGESIAAIARWYKVPYQRVYNYSYRTRVFAPNN